QRKAPDQRSGACSCAMPLTPQNRRFAPPRKMLVVNDTLPPGRRPQLRPQLKLPRSTYRYSAFRLTLLTTPTSSPAPTVQPALLMRPHGKGGGWGLRAPGETPPVKYGRKRSKAKPSRPRTVASHLLRVSQPAGHNTVVVPLMPDQSMSPSAPTTAG